MRRPEEQASAKQHREEPGTRQRATGDHRVVGVRYAITALLFLLTGLTLMLLIRWQLAYPGIAIPFVGHWLGASRAPDGIMLPEFYNQLGAMHGTIMVFLGVVPLAVGGFGNYLVPLQIGAANVAFPRLNAAGYWAYLFGGVVMLASFLLPGGAPSSGWTSYPPLADLATAGQTAWLVGLLAISIASQLGAITMIVTIVQLRTPGLPFLRLPFFVWTQLVTAFLLLLAFPPLQTAAVMQLMDRLMGSSFFLPSGLVVSGVPMTVSGGGSPLLWQHLFWFLAHPEVYVLILPAMGIVAEILTTNTRRPLYGYRLMVGSIVFLGFMSFLVWAHHMFLTGMGTTMSAFFQTTTMIVSIPSVVVLTCLLLSLWGGSIRFTTPMLFALTFLPMFGLGGLTGLPLSIREANIHLHDTYYVIGHFHYIVAPGTIFALFAGLYHWFPKATGRYMNDTLGRVHFVGTLLAMNAIFLPMFVQGLAGMNRRLYDGGAQYAIDQPVLYLHVWIARAAWTLALFQLPFIVNFFWSIRHGRVAPANPWGATTLDWTADAPRTAMAYTVEPRADTGFTTATLGLWLFLASLTMLFGALFSAYVLLRTNAIAWPHGAERLGLLAGALTTVCLMGSSWMLLRARQALRQGTPAAGRRSLAVATVLAGGFLLVLLVEHRVHMHVGDGPWRDTFIALYFTLTSVHAYLALGGVAVIAWLTGPGFALWQREPARLAHRTDIVARYFVFLSAVWLPMLVAFYLS